MELAGCMPSSRSDVDPCLSRNRGDANAQSWVRRNADQLSVSDQNSSGFHEAIPEGLHLMLGGS